ncbi:radical SAM protein [Ramlibacter sp. AN1133]|uniref:radical SAM protein n=1 Tax=Ramlibacter sp. AN1133 TaxID=3133429 RepID=UPI0030C6577F
MHPAFTFLAPSAPGHANPGPLERPMKTTLVITEQCNLDCRLCYGRCHEPKPRAELSIEEWRRIVDELAASGVIWLYIEGGEPFLKPGFVELLAENTPRMFTMVRTHGTLIDDVLAARLKAIDVGIVLVDLWGASAATHEALTGTPGSFERTVAGMRRLVSAGIETHALCILNRRNVHELQAWCDLVGSLGASAAGVLRLYPLGGVKPQWGELALSLDEMTAAVSGLRAPPGLRIMQSWHPRNANCCWQMSAINSFGDSIGCAYLREYVDFGNVLQQPFLQTWKHPLGVELRSGRVERSCTSCAGTQSSHGGCRSTAYAFHGRFSAPDPFDLELNDGIDLTTLPR